MPVTLPRRVIAEAVPPANRRPRPTRQCRHQCRSSLSAPAPPASPHSRQFSRRREVGECRRASHGDDFSGGFRVIMADHLRDPGGDADFAHRCTATWSSMSASSPPAERTSMASSASAVRKPWARPHARSSARFRASFWELQCRRDDPDTGGDEGIAQVAIECTVPVGLEAECCPDPADSVNTESSIRRHLIYARDFESALDDDELFDPGQHLGCGGGGQTVRHRGCVGLVGSVAGCGGCDRGACCGSARRWHSGAKVGPDERRRWASVKRNRG